MGQIVEMLKDKDSDVRWTGLHVLRACNAGERALHMQQIGEMLKDKDRHAHSSAVGVLKACDASE